MGRQGGFGGIGVAGLPFGQRAVGGLHLVIGGVDGQLKHCVRTRAGTRADAREDRQPRKLEAKIQATYKRCVKHAPKMLGEWAAVVDSPTGDRLVVIKLIHPN